VQENRRLSLFKKPDTACLNSMKRACTILLRAKKIKKFISLPGKGLRHFAKFFWSEFRMKRANLCKGREVQYFLKALLWDLIFANLVMTN